MSNISASVSSGAKARYGLLSELRGVAALMVIWYHVFEGFAFTSNSTIETLNHGYLTMDFFLILSSFVIGYAYDDRWGKGFTMKDFFKCRLIRLRPMVIIGAALSVITFCIQGSVQWGRTHATISMITLSLFCMIFLIPAMSGAGYEIRDSDEMFPLSGPCRSSFSEYIGSILYALFIRRLFGRVLAVFMVLLGVALAAFAVFSVSTHGSIGVDRTLSRVSFLGGFLRIFFPFSSGMPMPCNFEPMRVKGVFQICTTALITPSSVLCLGGLGPSCMNSVYEAFCMIMVFSIILRAGTSGTITDKQSTKICKLLGSVSYPVYVIYYPLTYLFHA